MITRRFFLAILLLIGLISLPAIGQSQWIQYGIEAGPNNALLSGSNPLARVYRPAVHASAGISIEYCFTEQVSLKSGLSFDRRSIKGAIISHPTNPSGLSYLSTGSERSYFDFFVLPVLIRLRLGSAENFFVNAGPTITYLINTHQKSSRVESVPPTHPISGQRFDYGLAWGAGKVFPLRHNRIISFELRGNLGLSQVAFAPFNESMRIHSISLVFGFAFRRDLERSLFSEGR